MPRIFKILSGKEVVKILETFGYAIRNQTGSHIKMLHIFEDNSYIIIVPNHKPIKLGTLSGIYKEVLQNPSMDINRVDKEFKN